MSFVNLIIIINWDYVTFFDKAHSLLSIYNMLFLGLLILSNIGSSSWRNDWSKKDYISLKNKNEYLIV